MADIILHILTLYVAHITCHEIDRPNIVFFIGDDIGWDDVSLHGSDQILTPNIDMIGYQGIIFPNYYTDCYGTPSRSALFTGKYPMRIGTQGPSIDAAEDRGIPISERLLPSYLKDLGYTSHLVGKWQLGKSREHFLPTMRGFDSFYGFTEGSVDYFTYNHVKTNNASQFFGLDFFHNLNPVRDQVGHLTNVLTNHAVKIINEHDTSTPLYLHFSHAAAHTGGGMVNLQAPGEDLRANGHIAHTARRIYGALVTGVDNSVGKVIAALADRDMLNNTLIIFVSDNGAPSIGPSLNYGSNLPLRGTKGTPWEGAVRSTAVLWHAGIDPKVKKGLFHVTDWLPTLVSAAGGDTVKHVDGVDHWDSLVNDYEVKPREHVIIAVDDLREWGAFRNGDLKVIVGSVPNNCGYYGHELNKVIHVAPDYEDKLLQSETSRVFRDVLGIGLDVAFALEKRDLCNLKKQIVRLNNMTEETKGFCVPTKLKGCLFNISADPEESQDLWDQFPEIAQHMCLRFRLLWSELVPRSLPVVDMRADPALHDYVWSPWLEDNEEPQSVVTNKSIRFPSLLTEEEFQYYVNMNLRVLSDKFTSYFKELANSLVQSIGIMLNT